MEDTFFLVNNDAIRCSEKDQKALLFKNLDKGYCYLKCDNESHSYNKDLRLGYLGNTCNNRKEGPV